MPRLHTPQPEALPPADVRCSLGYKAKIAASKGAAVDRADFIHLVRLSEHASAEDSAAYRRSVAGFAALGYLWVVGCFVVAIALLLWAASTMAHGRIKGFHIVLLITGGGLL